MQLYINGKWVKENEARVPIQDGGFLYGDCLFETVRVVKGQLFRYAKHLERLQQGMAVTRLKLSVTPAALLKLCQKFITNNDLRDGLLRIIVTRGTITGVPWDFSGAPNLYIIGRLFSPLPEQPARIVFVREKDYPIARFYPAIKSGNYLGNMLAKHDAQQQVAFEPVFVNRDGIITEGAIRNVFFIRDQALYTPTLELGVLPGVIRDTVLEIAAGEGLPIFETYIHYTDVNQFDEAFLSSTGIGILPIVWQGFHSQHHHTRRLQKLLEKHFTARN